MVCELTHALLCIIHLLILCTHMDTVTWCVSSHMHYYVLYTYLYCVYALVGRAISIRDPYICAIYETVPTHTC